MSIGSCICLPLTTIIFIMGVAAAKLQLDTFTLIYYNHGYFDNRTFQIEIPKPMLRGVIKPKTLHLHLDIIRRFPTASYLQATLYKLYPQKPDKVLQTYTMYLCQQYELKKHKCMPAYLHTLTANNTCPQVSLNDFPDAGQYRFEDMAPIRPYLSRGINRFKSVLIIFESIDSKIHKQIFNYETISIYK